MGKTVVQNLIGEEAESIVSAANRILNAVGAMSSAKETMPANDAFAAILAALPKTPSASGKSGFWATDEEILCGSEMAANVVADMLDAMGYTAVTGFYDPVEDEKAGEVDTCTGFYYITI